ncbi:MAG TPA: GTP cyclohydrolase I FolE2, partial [candidate division WOR-3 bacterium]|nr:GTP cyclohydrolase I FolE2 [candidate division WOR-3 bacterium]
MRDVQNEPDYRNIPLDKVGVEGLLYPINVMHREEGLMSTVATVSLTVDLPHNFRGTHMSRFVEVLKRFHGLIS